VTAATIGLLALSHGDLAAAGRWLREGIVQGTRYADIAGSVREICEVRLTIALAIAGERQAAADALQSSVRFCGDEFRLFEADRLLARAWVDAVSGLTGQAGASAVAAAELMRAQDRPTREVLCLQTATQFGNATTAPRLAELAAQIEGPRVAAASAHAAALSACDGARLLAAAAEYESFGDRIAAADAAAQAAVLLREDGLGGSALTATTVARRLAEACGADTPALRALTTPSVLTDRQREIIALAASGMTNRQIAQRLVMSIRTVEGHLFRASQRAGVNTREELIALLDGRRPTGSG
jgi:DNA-binding CsgD family transcriptional regulator